MSHLARAPYQRRTVPGSYDRGFFSVELANVQQAMPPQSIRTVTASTTATINDQTILADPTSAAITITLPAASTCENHMLVFKQINSNAHAVTIGGTVDGAASPTLGGTNKSITIQSDGAAWYKIAAV